MGFFGKNKIALDLGSSKTIVYINRKGIALKELSLLAVNQNKPNDLVFGTKAFELQGKTSLEYKLVQPIIQGRIHNYNYAKQMVAYFIKAAIRQIGSRPEVAIALPSSLSQVDQKAYENLLRDIGISRAMIIDAPFAAALGANLPVYDPKGFLLVDIGAGLIDVALISYGEIIASYNSNFGSQALNELIVSRVRDEHHLLISQDTAEKLKHDLGNAALTDSDKEVNLLVSGNELSTGLPTELKISIELVAKCVDQWVEQLVLSIRNVLRFAPPELAGDILQTGIVLTGGGAQLKRLPERLFQALAIPTNLAPNPVDAVILGTGKLLRSMDKESKAAEVSHR